MPSADAVTRGPQRRPGAGVTRRVEVERRGVRGEGRRGPRQERAADVAALRPGEVAGAVDREVDRRVGGPRRADLLRRAEGLPRRLPYRDPDAGGVCEGDRHAPAVGRSRDGQSQQRALATVDAERALRDAAVDDRGEDVVLSAVPLDERQRARHRRAPRRRRRRRGCRATGRRPAAPGRTPRDRCASAGAGASASRQVAAARPRRSVFRVAPLTRGGSIGLRSMP